MIDRWQPLLTAPYDGTELLLWGPEGKFAVVCIMEGGDLRRIAGRVENPTCWLPADSDVRTCCDPAIKPNDLCCGYYRTAKEISDRLKRENESL